MALTISGTDIDTILDDLGIDEHEIAEQQRDGSASSLRMIDFRQLDLLPPGARILIRKLHAKFIRQFKVQLVSSYSVPISFGNYGVDVIPFNKFLANLSAQTNLAVFPLHPLDGNGAAGIDPRLTDAILDCLFGGNGASAAADRDRDLTGIETRIMEKVFGLLLESLSFAWSSLVSIRPAMIAIETEQSADFLDSDEMAMVITTEAQIGQTPGIVTICIPQYSLDFLQAAGRRSPEPFDSDQESNRDAASISVQSLVNWPLMVETTSLHRIMKLEAGNKLEILRNATPSFSYHIADTIHKPA